MTHLEIWNKLVEFADLRDNWDSYGASPIESKVIEAVNEFVADYCCESVRPGSPIPKPDNVCPTNKGGVNLEWLEPEIELEFYPDGEGSYGFGLLVETKALTLAECRSQAIALLARMYNL